MKIEKGIHKALLWELFFNENPHANMAGQPRMLPKEFPLEKLFDAADAKKKFLPTFKEVKNDKGEIIGQQGFFNDSILDFTPGEIVILKELFDGKKNWSVDFGDVVKEVKDIFYPPKV